MGWLGARHDEAVTAHYMIQLFSTYRILAQTPPMRRRRRSRIHVFGLQQDVTSVARRYGLDRVILLIYHVLHQFARPSI